MKWCQDTARPTPEIEPRDVAPLATLYPRTLPRCNVRMKAVSFPYTRCHVCGQRAAADVPVTTRARGLPIATPHTTHRTWHSARDACQAETTRGHVACRRIPALGPTDRALREDRSGARPCVPTSLLWSPSLTMRRPVAPLRLSSARCFPCNALSPGCPCARTDRREQ